MNREHGVEKQNGETETTDIVGVEQPNRETETTDTISSDQEVLNADEAETNNISLADQEDYKLQDWVAVSFDGNCHVEQITDFDDKDGEFEMKFLRKTSGKTNNKPTFKWPAPDDILDISIDQIICIVRH